MKGRPPTMFIILIILWLWLETPEPQSTTLLSFEADRIASEPLKMIVVALGAGVGVTILIPLCCFINHHRVHLLRDPYNRNSLFEKAPAKLKTDTTVCSAVQFCTNLLLGTVPTQVPSKMIA